MYELINTLTNKIISESHDNGLLILQRRQLGKDYEVRPKIYHVEPPPFVAKEPERKPVKIIVKVKSVKTRPTKAVACYKGKLTASELARRANYSRSSLYYMKDLEKFVIGKAGASNIYSEDAVKFLIAYKETVKLNKTTYISRDNLAKETGVTVWQIRTKFKDELSQFKTTQGYKPEAVGFLKTIKEK